MLEALKAEVCEANLALVRHGLVTLTWGNVSGIDRASGRIVIKPSGVPYEKLTPESMTVLSLEDGRVVEGAYAPSTDAPTHLAFYRAWKTIGGAVHTHSCYATAFAEAGRELPCLGTTHADHFYGTVPVARMPTAQEINEGYEKNIGAIIIERFKGLDPLAMPGVLAAGHAPFTWGATPQKAVENAVALEACAKMAFIAYRLNPALGPLPPCLLDKHYLRKHGPNAYYGQKAKAEGSH